MKSKKKIVLAYSGGLDTSIILKWLQENYDADVICYTADVGQEIDRKKIITNAKKFGVKNIIIKDLKDIFVKNYVINLNAREISNGDSKLRLTEKEINTILYLKKNKNPIKVEELESNVWKYQSDIETHTVETHIYRLRKKILNTFNDKDFIISEKNGYQIK